MTLPFIIIAFLALPPFCLLCFSGLRYQIVDLPASEYLPKESIVLILFPQGGVFLFEPVIAPSQTFIVPVYAHLVRSRGSLWSRCRE